MQLYTKTTKRTQKTSLKEGVALVLLLRSALPINRSAAGNPANPAGKAAFAIAQRSLNTSGSITLKGGYCLSNSPRRRGQILMVPCYRSPSKECNNKTTKKTFKFFACLVVVFQKIHYFVCVNALY
jgi:hypothetical protein